MLLRCFFLFSSCSSSNGSAIKTTLERRSDKTRVLGGQKAFKALALFSFPFPFWPSPSLPRPPRPVSVLTLLFFFPEKDRQKKTALSVCNLSEKPKNSEPSEPLLFFPSIFVLTTKINKQTNKQTTKKKTHIQCR